MVLLKRHVDILEAAKIEITRMNILIMTATITPPLGAPGLLRIDPKIRLADYEKALSYYVKALGKTIDRIIFAENSNSNIDKLREIVSETGKECEVEFLVYDGMDHPASYGRCYSESKLLDHVMSTSKIVTCAGKNDFFWKVTGRYSLLNLRAMIASRPNCNFYCDLRSYPSPWADMRFMGWTKAGYQSIYRNIAQHIREDTNGGRPGEETLYRRLHGTFSAFDGFATVLAREPLFDGVRAYDNKNWSKGRQWLVFIARQIQRLLLRKVYF